VRQDLLDHRRLEVRRSDLQLPGAAVRAVLHVDAENPLEQPHPAGRRTLARLACCSVFAWYRGGIVLLTADTGLVTWAA
jgi:hypothetical protein